MKENTQNRTEQNGTEQNRTEQTIRIHKHTDKNMQFLQNQTAAHKTHNHK